MRKSSGHFPNTCCPGDPQPALGPCAVTKGLAEKSAERLEAQRAAGGAGPAVDYIGKPWETYRNP